MYSSSNCGRTVKITNTANSKSTTATVADEVGPDSFLLLPVGKTDFFLPFSDEQCPGCSSSTSIDLSEATFEAIGDLDTGVLTVEWEFTVRPFLSFSSFPD
jgi:hypothetical protein